MDISGEPATQDVAASSRARAASALRPLRVLLVEDSEDDATLVMRALHKGGYAVTSTRVEDAEGMRSALATEAWDLVVSDWSMPHFDARAALQVLQDSAIDIPFLIASGTVDEETAVAAMLAGAGDFLPKNKLTRLVPAVDRELRKCAERRARRRAEDELLASEARHRAIFENSPLPMWVYDVDTLAFLMVNDAALRQYGYRRDELLGMTIAGLRPADDAFSEEPVARPDQVRPRRHRRKDGSILWVEVTTHTFAFEGRAARLVLANDVTRRLQAEESLRKTEEQLRHAQKMEAVGRLAGGVSHDFNNVLSVILSYSELMLADLKPGDPLRDDAQEICTAAQRAAGLTRQLLLFSRQRVVEAAVLDLNHVVAGMKNMLGRLLGEDVELSLLLSPSLGRVLADAGHIEQVVMNLTVNARDAMPGGGRLTIESKNVALGEAYGREHHGLQAGDYVMLAVTDTGSGMDAETKARIFEPFFTTKETGKGTGLGLSTVFAIVRQAGGCIEVQSEPGRGATFVVHLPRTDAAPSPAATVALGEQEGGTETVLVVDDDAQVRAVACDVLRRLGYHVLDAAGGGEALLLAEEHPGAIHLLLTDVVLPRMSGPEIAARFHARRPEATVLFMSGYSDEGILSHGMLESGAAYLQKPITPDALGRRVRAVLGSKKGV